jgi:hypothetical protein
MTEPLDTLQENEEKGTKFDVLELFDESESEDESEDLDVGEDLHDFLTITIKGPQLDEQTVGLLFNNGVEDSRSFCCTRSNPIRKCFRPSVLRNYSL